MTKAIRVLVVEDSEDDSRLAMRALRRAGFEPRHRRVQDVAALRAALSEEQWDAVLSDFSLPGFTGVDALKVFRETELDIPFIFVSGTIGEEIAVTAMKAGASDYVMKHNIARLAPALERELAQARIRAAHRRAQIELVQSRDRYVDLYDYAPVGYLTLSGEGLIVQLNQTGAEMLGEPRERLQGTSFDRFVALGDAAVWRARLSRTVHHGERQRIELVLRRDDGSHLHAQLDFACLVAEQAAPMARVTISDISERKTAEADRRKFETQLRHMQKLESVGTLAGGIAHDFNNILGGILGNVTLVRRMLGGDHDAQSSLEEIQKASLRARDLVRQILTFSRRQPQELSVQLLRPVYEETFQLLRATLPARVELEVVLTEDPVYVKADATQVQQVLMNLCTNAWHALKDGAGRITMGLEAAQYDGVGAHRGVAGLPLGRYAHLWVSDTGIGMDPETRERIFEPFFTTKPVGQGTGLGLSVVHGIVTAHNGVITVDSQAGLGSSFHLYLPATDAPGGPPLEQAPPPAAPGRGERVLYVDDDPTMVLMVQRMLERAGYSVSTFEDSALAIEALRQQPKAFDLVLTDYNMPGFSGLEVAREVVRLCPGLPVAISSGYITDELRAQADEAGVRWLLEKQNTFQELEGLVARLLSRTVE
ncbi:MAG TPA: response regulator [Ideonella sp.]|uniref:hybrid sensor histidine kinase/response regulator n=1 Tax=Ideonella sp. TaxID=1929293 RepID=UPI002E37D384|nr:response regulator [Ideonella sp.]HEX5685863.1 response regulator [Ideonella sp.]